MEETNNKTEWLRHAEDCVVFYTAPIIPVRHAFTTRLGGVSTGTLQSLNLSVRRGDTPRNVRENFRRLSAATGMDLTRMVYARQVHGTEVHPAVSAELQESEREPRFLCDGFVTNEPGVPIAVFMADCLPVLLHDAEHGVIGAVHCGWRSSVGDILAEALRQMTALGAEISCVRAAIGPGIGFDHFEVGDEVIHAAERLIGDVLPFVRTGPNGRPMLDLKGVNAARLRQLGVPEAQISVSDLCTMCMPDVFWSHRATHGARGVQAAIITL